MTVVKVGGSLFDHPNLGPALCVWLETVGDDVTLIAGGGPLADAVRRLDRVHRLGEEAAHWLALESLAVTRAVLERLTGRPVLDLLAFAREDDGRPGSLPHTWEVTTDSLAARVAAVQGARLILLKSVGIPAGTDWPTAAANGWVDAHFPKAVGPQLRVEVVNFRRLLADPPAGV